MTETTAPPPEPPKPRRPLDNATAPEIAKTAKSTTPQKGPVRTAEEILGIEPSESGAPEQRGPFGERVPEIDPRTQLPKRTSGASFEGNPPPPLDDDTDH